MKKVTKNIKTMMFIFIATSLFAYKSIMPMHGHYLSTVETDKNIRERIRENVFSNIGIRDFVKTIKRLKALFIDNEMPDFTSKDLSSDFEDLPHELQLYIGNFLSPTNREVLRCCSTLFRDGISREVTDRDLLVYPDDIVTIFKEMSNASQINAAAIISKENLIQLLAAGRNGLFNKDDERTILNIYNGLIDIDDYVINTIFQTNNPSINELAHFLYPESINGKRLVFLINKILSIGFGLPEILSAQFMLNLDIISSSSNLIFSSNRMENFQNIKLSVLKKLGLYLTELNKIFNPTNLTNLDNIKHLLVQLLCMPRIASLIIRYLLLFEGSVFSFKTLSSMNTEEQNIFLPYLIINIIWEIIANPLYDSALGPYEY